MEITQIGDQWFRLVSDDGELKLTWFGYSRTHVVGMFKSYVRELDLDRIRHRPKHTVLPNTTGKWV